MEWDKNISGDKRPISLRFIKILLLAFICLGLPLIGVSLTGNSLKPYFRFPPPAAPSDYPHFSPYLFCLLVVLVSAIIGIYLGLRKSSPVLSQEHNRKKQPFPRWGWIGIAALVTFWILAWSRYSWFSAFQLYTFTPLWLAYIIVINALIHWRIESSPMFERPKLFFLYFPLSSVFWWGFEYLNRFVYNWRYLGLDEVSVGEYFIHASLSFSTVLPAVFSTQQLLQTYPSLQSYLDHCPPVVLPWEKELAIIILFALSLAFVFIGLYPHIVYPLLWAGPLLCWLSINRISGRPINLGGITRGTCSYTLTWAFAALICGFCWEMWNFFSFAKWVYTIPYFQAFHIFEMPLAGYLGYLPFGLECAVIISFFNECLTPESA